MGNDVARYTVKQLLNMCLNDAEDGLQFSEAAAKNPSGTTDPGYESQTITIPPTTTNYDVKVTGGMFSLVPIASYIVVKNTDSSNAISVKLNETGNDAINVPASSSFTLPRLLAVSDIYITNASGGSVDAEILLFE